MFPVAFQAKPQLTAMLKERMGEIEAQVAALWIKQNPSQATKAAQKLGHVRRFLDLPWTWQQCMRSSILTYLMHCCSARHDTAVCGMQVWMRQTQKLLQLPCLLPMTENAPIVGQACKAVLDKFRIAPYSMPAQTGKVFPSEWCSACYALYGSSLYLIA